MFITDLEHLVFYKSLHTLIMVCNTRLRTLVFIYHKKYLEKWTFVPEVTLQMRIVRPRGVR